MTMTESVEQVAEKLGLFARVGLFYRQVVSELRKVVWPTRKQLTTYTAVVLVFVSFIWSSDISFPIQIPRRQVFQEQGR